MKIPCEVIRDLLPLVHDGACSEQSAALVEAHLKDCEACRARLAALQEELGGSARQSERLEEAKPIRAIARSWRRDKTRAFLRGTLVAALVCSLLVGIFAGLTQWRIIPVSAEVLEVSDVCRLPDGRIAFHLYVNDDKNLFFIRTTPGPDGAYSITPMRAVLESSRRHSIGAFDRHYAVDPANDHPNGEITSIQVGPPGDAIIIWEAGIELPPASREVEAELHRGS